MNNCSLINLDFINGNLSTGCDDIPTSTSYYRTSDFFTADKLEIINNNAAYFRLCKFDKNYNFLSKVDYINSTNKPNSRIVRLDSTYLYKFSYFRGSISNLTTNVNVYKCTTFSTMSEQLAFGSGNSLFTNLNELTPLFIILIGFILGYWFLRKIIKKGQKGGTL